MLTVNISLRGIRRFAAVLALFLAAFGALAGELPLKARLGRYKTEIEDAIRVGNHAEAVRIYEDKLLPAWREVKLSENEATAISVLKQYTTAQVVFQVGKQGREKLNTGLLQTGD